MLTPLYELGNVKAEHKAAAGNFTIRVPLNKKSYSSSLLPMVGYNHLPETAVAPEILPPALTRVQCQDERRQCACYAGGAAKPPHSKRRETPRSHVTHHCSRFMGKIKCAGVKPAESAVVMR